MQKLTFIFMVIFLTTSSLLACSGLDNKPSQSPSGGSTNATTPAATTNGWASFEVNTVTTPASPSQVKHNDYLAGSHSSFKCNDCHSITQTDPATQVVSFVSRDKICAYCHPLSKYSSLMTDANHASLNAGDHCNGCHNSTSGAAGSPITGWRWSSTIPRTRVQPSLWHKDVKGTCLNCHTASAVPSYPANHYNSACETCHTYGTGS